MKKFTHVLVGNKKRPPSSFDLIDIRDALKNIQDGDDIISDQNEVSFINYELKDGEKVFLYGLENVSNEDLLTAENKLKEMLECGGKYFISPYYFGIKVFK